MKNLLDFVFCAALLTVCFGREFEGGSLESDDISIGETAGQSLKCPGICQMEPCATSLPDADCDADKTCCLDHLEKITATEFAESEFTTESLLDSSLVQEVETDEIPEEIEISVDGEQLAEEETSEVYLEDVESSQSKESPEYVYSQVAEDDYQQTGPINYEVIDEGSLSYTSSDPYETSFAQNFKCPGRCTPSDRLTECSHLYSDTRLCPYGTVCCFEDHSSYEQQRVPAGRSVEQVPEYNCPGSCMHPSHMMFCERVLSQYTCPLNSKCCMLPTAIRSQTKEPIQCKGTCLPFHMNGYCLPPSEIVMGPTTCEQGSSCCMLNPKNTQPPRFKAMAFPSQTTSTNIDVTSNLLGHLAVDDAGNVFKVSKNGLISPLKSIPNGFNTNHLIRLANYPRINGDIVIYSSPTGELFQQFIPRQSSQTPIRQPIRQFDSQASEQSTTYQANIAEKDQSDVNRDNVMDIVIPDDDDEAPVTKNSPLVHSDKSSRPPCPGSCMSYFLRFTCFRGYAIYDGFTCPGRGVCCARLKEIEEHEQYLKSLSPYFNAPPSRDSTVTRCGIKGRRDTPRIIGGKDALSGEWCWQVAIINVQNQYLCGGALIDNSWVLTAAHCVVSSLEEGQALFIRAGVTDLKSKEDNSQSQTIRVLSIFIHHNFNSRNLDNNIALLRLQKPVELSSFVCVVCLPTNKIMPTDGTKCTVTGFGFVAPEGGMSLRIREAKVPIVDDVECMTNVTEALELPFIIPSSSFCAGGAGAEDACQGDAGGALACEVSGFHELIGLVSWGLGCGKDYVPSIYVKIPAFMGWINQIISSSSFVLPSSQV